MKYTIIGKQNSLIADAKTFGLRGGIDVPARRYHRRIQHEL